MAFERRGNNSYYYRKERAGGGVRSVYVGRGETARLIAQLDDLERNAREEGRAVARLERERWQAQDAELDALGVMMDAVATGVLLASGYHTHKRQWRRKRHE